MTWLSVNMKRVLRQSILICKSQSFIVCEEQGLDDVLHSEAHLGQPEASAAATLSQWSAFFLALPGQRTARYFQINSKILPPEASKAARLSWV